MKNKIKVTQCSGYGQGSCTLCESRGIWNRAWMCFLYKVEGHDGCYCSSCVREISMRENKEIEVEYEN